MSRTLPLVLGGLLLLGACLGSGLGWAKGRAPKKTEPARVLISGHIKGSGACPGAGGQAMCAIAHLHLKNDFEVPVESLSGSYTLVEGSGQTGGLPDVRTGPLVLTSGSGLTAGEWGFLEFPVWTPPSADATVKVTVALDFKYTGGVTRTAHASCELAFASCDRSPLCTLVDEAPPAKGN